MCICSKTPEVPLFLVFERDLDTREQIYLGCQKQPTAGFEAPTPIIPWWLGAILRSEGRGLWNCIVLKPWYFMCLGILDPSSVLVIRGRAGVRRQSPDAFGCRFVIYKSWRNAPATAREHQRVLLGPGHSQQAGRLCPRYQCFGPPTARSDVVRSSGRSCSCLIGVPLLHVWGFHSCMSGCVALA